MTPRLSKNITLLLLFSNSLLLNAQKKIEYNIIGNNKIEEQAFIKLINESNGSYKNIKEKISNNLSSQGFFDYEIMNFFVDTNDTKNSIYYTLELYEGEQAIIRNIVIDSLNNSDSLYILDYFNFLEGEIFVPSILESSINEALIFLENNGYPFAGIKIKSIVLARDNDSNRIADIFLELDKEKIRKIDKVEILGNTKTNDNVIINAARLKYDELFSQKRINEISTQLNRLRFFETVAPPIYLVNSNGEGILQITVTEKNTNMFDGIIGYVPAARNEDKGYLTGFVNISLRNIFGTGRAFAIRWKQENSLTQELELKYLEPWILDYPFNLNLDFFQRKQDSSYVRRTFGGELEYLATDNISAAFILETESVIPSINNSNQSVLNSTSLNSGLKIKVDYRDDIYTPQSGIYFASLYKYRAKNIDDENLPVSFSSSDLEYHNYELDFGIFYSLFQSQVVALSVHAKEIIGDYYDASDYFQFGGTNTLRGYRENQFLGNRIIWSNLEYRFLLSQSSYLFTFFDSGYYLINENESINIARKSDYINGYGLGISLDTALGVMRVSYAFAEGTSISDGLIHFGLLNDF
jgi:outer membrane protein assembly factor BamA